MEGKQELTVYKVATFGWWKTFVNRVFFAIT